ncbi:MAG: hypothetical protein BWK75_06050 [Candidatus Altiarchaeales archaeon A3]|nr:MAG: hypothetical protein BWK75_06050 [Candidatus Altiarchaeales archaeon A3]
MSISVDKKAAANIATAAVAIAVTELGKTYGIKIAEDTFKKGVADKSIIPNIKNIDLADGIVGVAGLMGAILIPRRNGENISGKNKLLDVLKTASAGAFLGAVANLSSRYSKSIAKVSSGRCMQNNASRQAITHNDTYVDNNFRNTGRRPI